MPSHCRQRACFNVFFHYQTDSWTLLFWIELGGWECFWTESNVRLHLGEWREKLLVSTQVSRVHLQTMSRGFWCAGCHGTRLNCNMVISIWDRQQWSTSATQIDLCRVRLPTNSTIRLCELVWINEKVLCWGQYFKSETHRSPQKEVVASRLRSRGGAHLDHIPWHAG